MFHNIPIHNVSLRQSRHRKAHTAVLCSFLLSALIFVLSLAASHMYPFGEYNSFFSDANAYYINYLSYWRRVLRGQESLFYSFTKGIGGSTAGLVAYHLLNPWMLLFGLVDTESFPLMYTVVSILSVSTCGLTMYILLKDLYPDHVISGLIFSTSYALCGYNVVNSWQLQWLTGVMLFPLLVLGIRKILNGKSGIFYTIVLACTLISSFYIGYMCTIGAVLIFIAMYATRNQAGTDRPAAAVNQPERKDRTGKKGRAGEASPLLRFVIGTILGGLLSAFIWLPALLSLRGGRADAGSYQTFDFTENGKLLSIGAKLFTGTHSIQELRNGLPAIFCGIVPLVLCILFFLDRNTEKRKKAAAGALLGIYLLSFYVNTLSVIFQGFSYTVWFNYRYSFIFSFLMIMTAVDEACRLEQAEKKDVRRTLIVLCAAVVLIFAENLEFAARPYYLIDLGILALIGGAVRLYRKQPGEQEKRTLMVLVLVCTVLNLYANDVISNQEVKEWFSSYADTKSGIEMKKVLVDYVTDQDSSFYRMESEVNREGSTALDPMMFDYNGTSLAGSVEKDFVKKNLARYGIQWFDNRNYYDAGVSASMDALLGIKYVISTRDLEQEKRYERLNTSMGMTVYKNPYALLPAILSSGEIDGVDVENEHDVFRIQNEVWSSLVGDDVSVEGSDLYTEETDISYTSHNPEEAVTVTTGESGTEHASGADTADQVAADSTAVSADTAVEGTDGLTDVWDQLQMDSVFTDDGRKTEVTDDDYYILVQFTASFDGPYYLYAYGYVDGSYGSAHNTLQYLGEYHKGDSVTAKLSLDGTVTKSALDATVENTWIACLDMDLFQKYSGELEARDITVEKSAENDAHLYGGFIAKRDQKLFFTIPYDAGWSLYIDGKPAEVVKSASLFMSATAPEGEHTYELVFVPEGLRAGLVMSLLAVALTVLFAITERRRRREAEKDRPETEQNNRQ